MSRSRFPPLPVFPTHFSSDFTFLARDEIPADVQSAIEKQMHRERLVAQFRAFRKEALEVSAKSEGETREAFEAEALVLAARFRRMCEYWKVPSLLQTVFWWHVTDEAAREPLDLVPEYFGLVRHETVRMVPGGEGWHENVEVAFEGEYWGHTWHGEFTGFGLLRFDLRRTTLQQLTAAFAALKAWMGKSFGADSSGPPPVRALSAEQGVFDLYSAYRKRRRPHMFGEPEWARICAALEKFKREGAIDSVLVHGVAACIAERYASPGFFPPSDTVIRAAIRGFRDRIILHRGRSG